MYNKRNVIITEDLFSKAQQENIKESLTYAEPYDWAIIAGGAVVDWSQGKKPKDIDIFIKTNKIPKLFKKLVRLPNDAYNKSKRLEFLRVVKNKKFNYDLCFIKTDLCIEDYINRFDFSISKAYLEDLEDLGKIVGLTPINVSNEVDESFKTKTIIMNPDREKELYTQKRVKRYKEKYPDFKIYQEL